MTTNVTLLSNRSMPTSVVIPVLGYEDVRQAVEWLCRCFGFTERLRIGSHRAQLNVGQGAVVVSGRDTSPTIPPFQNHSLLVRVPELESHFLQAQAAGVKIVSPPTTYPYGERQYTAEDIGGHLWTFSQTVSDSDPASWGGCPLRRNRLTITWQSQGNFVNCRAKEIR